MNPEEVTPDILDSFEIRVRSIATQWQKMGVKFGDKLERASPDMFTFLRCPGMAPISNKSERMLRRFVIHRKIRMSLGSTKCMQVVENVKMTWRKCVLNTDTVHTRGKLEERRKSNQT